MMDARTEAVALAMAHTAADRYWYPKEERERYIERALPQFREDALKVITAADAHPTPAQLRAREMLASINDVGPIAGPLTFADDEIFDDLGKLVMTVGYQIDAPAICDLLNLACGWEAADE